ncbi:type II 3-dehydroquinate dehydratase [Candidatus Portiera aleyrodidarum]|uniref:3-dehydroquinate dehydratase n=1 Tax=Candidatus Portiera aleyrodidarum MED (Bemisia tabaci) TaxID=1163752 RepID=A0AAU8RPJ8_9GAMM|nr:type II 3-dehydroquinate dehydratase [Candidatus Portiera aleyrodidarum]AFQ24160.1 3-dehydroquinate dehydratase II [Candidatus Portiera aleyrodidarum BT-B-HRs]AFS18919.1 3-dehydroquinate dehydratase [Candidatus Portiera aleyrodidarum BT-QVLC]AFT80561.1 3-dehydroquinate dehydratase II [Candidatus Portiera aleyrodidarum BT-QVLC]AFT80840.1 3-dehydroquinate dehydratase II [Candidatus Portiera aleyrodidarum BT-B-HRs]AJF24135.1 3-dehydroquinate dehydratase [Candidatus Portiera aleyrodidarum MED (
MKIFLINGPNLNYLGKRQTNIYGYNTLQDIERFMIKKAKRFNVNLECYQSNHEGYIIDIVHRAYYINCNSIIINAGAYSHTSIPILDALTLFNGLIIEVHISNIYNREVFRHTSFISKRANAIISGLGVYGYISALNYLIKS